MRRVRKRHKCVGCDSDFAHLISFSFAHSVKAAVRFNLDDVVLSDAVFTAERVKDGREMKGLMRRDVSGDGVNDDDTARGSQDRAPAKAAAPIGRAPIRAETSIIDSARCQERDVGLSI